jgi:hypothetical protein
MRAAEMNATIVLVTLVDVDDRKLTYADLSLVGPGDRPEPHFGFRDGTERLFVLVRK